MGRKKIHFDVQPKTSQQSKRQEQLYFGGWNMSTQPKRKCEKVVDFIGNVLDQEMIDTLQSCLDSESQKVVQMTKFKASEKLTIRMMKCRIKELKILIAMKKSEDNFLSGELNSQTFADKMSDKVDLAKSSIIVMFTKFFKMSKKELKKYFELKKEPKSNLKPAVKIQKYCELKNEFKNNSKSAAKIQSSQKKSLEYFQCVLKFLQKIQNRIPLVNRVFQQKFQEFIEIKLKNKVKAKQRSLRDNQLEEDYVLLEDLFIISILYKFKQFIKERKTQQKDIDAVISDEIYRSTSSINQRIRNICWLKSEDLQTYILRNHFLAFDQTSKTYYFHFEKENVENLMKIKNKEMIKKLRNFIKIKKVSSPLTPQKISSLKQIYNCNQDIQKSYFVLPQENQIQKNREFLEQIPELDQNNFMEQKQILDNHKSFNLKLKQNKIQISITKHQDPSLKSKQISVSKKRIYSSCLKELIQPQDQTTQYSYEARDKQLKNSSSFEPQIKEKNNLKKKMECSQQQGVQQSLSSDKVQKEIKINCQMSIRKSFKDYQELKSSTRMVQSVILNDSAANNYDFKRKDEKFKVALQNQSFAKDKGQFLYFRERISKYLKNVVNRKMFNYLQKKLTQTTQQYSKLKANKDKMEDKYYIDISSKFLDKARKISLPIMMKQKQNEINDRNISLDESLKQVCTILQLNFEDTKKDIFELTSLRQELQHKHMMDLVNSQIQKISVQNSLKSEATDRKMESIKIRNKQD